MRAAGGKTQPPVPGPSGYLTAVSSPAGALSSWFLKNGGFASNYSLGTVNTQWHIAGVGDFNGDGNADLVWENTTTGARNIWLLKNGVLSSSYSLGTVNTQWHIEDH